jgi:hypothetical protein
VSRSVNEVTGLAAKAARGAGAPPAQAAQFGAAAAVFLQRGGDPHSLTAALAALPAGPVMALPVALARLAETQTDGSAQGVLGVDHDELFYSYIAALPCHARITQDGVVRLDLNRPAPRGAGGRIDLPDDVIAAWSILAARILVPDTASSRASGAGAGLSDND